MKNLLYCIVLLVSYPIQVEGQGRNMIIIGVGDYTHLSDLTATRDAQVMEVAAEQVGYNTYLLVGDEAEPVTSDKIRDEFQRLVGDLDENDRLDIFIGCHGGQINGADHLLLTEYDPSDRGDPDNKISLSEIYSLAVSTGAGRIVLFTDACRNPLGTNLNGDEISAPQAFSPYERQEDVLFYSIAATSNTNYSYEDDILKIGIFTNMLVTLIADRSVQTKADIDRNRRISILELHNYLLKEVVNFTSQAERIRTAQMPALYAEGPMDYDFIDFSVSEPTVDSILEDAWHESQLGFPNWRLGIESGVGEVGCRLGYSEEYRTSAPLLLLDDQLYRPYLFKSEEGNYTLVYYNSLGSLPPRTPVEFTVFVNRIADIPKAVKTASENHFMVDYTTGWLTVEKLTRFTKSVACVGENAVIFSFSSRK